MLSYGIWLNICYCVHCCFGMFRNKDSISAKKKKIVKATVHTNDIVRNIVSILCASSMTLVACMTWVAPTIWVACIAWLGALDYTTISLIDMNIFYDLCCFYDLCIIYGLKMLYDKFRPHIVSNIHDLQKSMSFIFSWIVPHL